LADPSHRSKISSIGADALHAKYPVDYTTKAGRAAAEDKLTARLSVEVDPDGSLRNSDRLEFERRLFHARRAHFKKLSLQGVAARRRRRREAAT
jgi:hypothetical protein